MVPSYLTDSDLRLETCLHCLLRWLLLQSDFHSQSGPSNPAVVHELQQILVSAKEKSQHLDLRRLLYETNAAAVPVAAMYDT